MLRLVEAGLGITIVPPGACASHDRDQIRVIRLAEAWAERTLKICYRDLKLLPVTARMLIEHLRAETAAHETSRRLP